MGVESLRKGFIQHEVKNDDDLVEVLEQLKK